jgi:HSP20 family protein
MAIDRRRTTGGYVPLRDAIDRLFEGSFIAPQMMSGQTGFSSANVHVSDDDVIIEMAVPGVKPEDINISVTGDTVTISGETTREQRDRTGRTYVEEIFEGAFQRSFTLPFPVNVNQAQATFENGMLRLTLPKSEEAKPRQVQIKPQQSLGGQTQTDQQSQQSQTQGQQRQQAQTQQSQQPAAGDAQRERVPAGSGQTS